MSLKPEWMAEADWQVVKELPYKQRERTIISLRKEYERQPKKQPTLYADGVDPRYSARPKK